MKLFSNWIILKFMKGYDWSVRAGSVLDFLNSLVNIKFYKICLRFYQALTLDITLDNFRSVELVSASMGVFIILFDKSFCELKLNFQIRVEIVDVEPFWKKNIEWNSSGVESNEDQNYRTVTWELISKWWVICRLFIVLISPQPRMSTYHWF